MRGWTWALTAKLRTLVSYLELVAELHARWAGLGTAQLTALAPSPRDPLGVWARQHLLRAKDKRLAPMLEAAMERKYSANPGEAFFTGGGLHQFENFERSRNNEFITVREGFKHSINLVFIRLMRDVVRHRMFGGESDAEQLLKDPADPRRRELLVRFADREGSAFLMRFYRKYQRLPAADAQALLLRGVRPSAPRLASVLFTVEPEADEARLEELLTQKLGRGYDGSPRELRALRTTYANLSLADRGYVARVHPLELWLVGYLQKHPGATLAEVLNASTSERQEVYAWLFKTRHKSAQDTRLRELIEIDAFAQIHRSWQRLGYPFESLTPSYASAIGASGDRPAALAELMGIIASDGMRQPVQRVGSLHFARDTPYETRLEPRNASAEQVLPAEVAATVRQALVQVVQDGTARRLEGRAGGCERPRARSGRQDRHRRPSLRPHRRRAQVCGAQDQPLGHLRVHHWRPLLRHHHGLRARAPCRALQVHQRAANAAAQVAGAATAAGAGAQRLRWRRRLTRTPQV